MGCFCRVSVALAQQQLALLAAPPGGELPGAAIAIAVSGFFAARGLPAAPWQPDPAWLDQPLPTPQLSVSAIATISALVQLRVQALEQFGIDLLIPAQASGFSRVVATMNARFAEMSASGAGSPTAVATAAWVQLAQLNAAVDHVQAVLQAGLLAPSPAQMLELAMPGGLPIGQWGALLRPLRLLAPLIAAALQLGADVQDVATLAAALKQLGRVSLPVLAMPELVADLNATLSALASLKASLGAAALAAGFVAMQQSVQAKLDILIAALSAQFGMPLAELPGAAAQSPLAGLMAMLPKLPVAPGQLATSASVRLALQAQALAAVSWNVPAILPTIAIGFATCSLAANMQAALGIEAVLSAPCGGSCDAAALMRAAGSVSGLVR